MSDFKIITADVMEGLRQIPSGTARCCVTSPPYWGLRDYGVAGQIGQETSFQAFADKLVAVFEEVKRVLTDDGTLWLNMGDSYAGSWGNYGGKNRGHGMQRSIPKGSQLHQKAWNGREEQRPPGSWTKGTGLKNKDLIGQPWALAFALRGAGWWLRQDIIWSKTNCMPESVLDRPTRSHEYLFLMAKTRKYYYNAKAIKEPVVSPRLRDDYGKSSGFNKSHQPGKENSKVKDQKRVPNEMRNRRTVWTMAVSSYREAHFATFPEKLVEPCILGGSQEGDTILDPFTGSGTTGYVALKNGRKFVGIELNPEYVAIAEKRLIGGGGR